MTFATWIEDKGGAARVARLLGLTPHAVRTWLRRESVPRHATIYDILRLAQYDLHNLTYEGIVRECSPKRKTVRK